MDERIRSALETAFEVSKHYEHMRVMDDGTILGVHRLLFHWTLHIDIDPVGYRHRYCFWRREDALLAMRSYAGRDPERWHKHIPTERRRNWATGEIVADERAILTGHGWGEPSMEDVII